MDRKTKIIIISLVVVLLLTFVGAAGVAFWFMNQPPAVPPDPNQAPENQIKVVMSAAVMGNVSDEKSHGHILRILPEFWLNADHEDFENIILLLPEEESLVRTEIIKVIRSYTFDMVNSQDAIERLSIDIKDAINKLYDTTAIYKVAFHEFTVQ